MTITRSLILLVGLFSCITPLFGQSGCDNFFPMRAGVAWEMVHYDGEGVCTGQSRTKLTDQRQAQLPGMTSWLVTTYTTTYPQKKTYMTSYNMTCSGIGVGIDMQQRPAYTDRATGTNLVLESSSLVYPHDMSVGMSLPEARLAARVIKDYVEQPPHLTLIVHHRQVTGEATKSVPAGTFECLVIEQDEDYTNGQDQHSTHTKIWLSRGNGIIAEESFEKGKRIAYSEMSAIQR